MADNKFFVTFAGHALLVIGGQMFFSACHISEFQHITKYQRIMKTNYVVPSIEVIEIELEDAVLGVSDFIYGDSLGTFDE